MGNFSGGMVGDRTATCGILRGRKNLKLQDGRTSNKDENARWGAMARSDLKKRVGMRN